MGTNNDLDDKSSGRNQLRLTPDEEDRIYRRSVLEGLQNELIAWAKKRFWIVAIIAVILGWVGVTVIIKDLVRKELREATRAGAVAETAADQASKAALKVRSELNNFNNTIGQLKEEANKVSSDLTNVKTMLLSEQNRIEEDAGHTIAKAQLQLKNIDSKLNDLSKFVINLSKEIESNKTNLSTFLSEKEQLNEEKIIDEKKFAENSEYKISVINKQDEDGSLESAKVYKRLVNEGFKVSRNWFRDTSFFLGDQIVIQYSPNSKEKAKEVLNIVKSEIEPKNSIILSEAEYLQSTGKENLKYYIRVMLNVDAKHVE